MPAPVKSTPFCHRCNDAKVITSASYKCLQCKVKLCSSCAQNHMILRPCLDYRIIDLRTGKSVDSLFSIEPDIDIEREMLKYSNKDKSANLTSTESPYQVVRTFGKPVMQITLRKSNKIVIPVTPISRSSSDGRLNEFEDARKKRIEAFSDAEASVKKGEFNENGDFFPDITIKETKKPKTILKRTSSFRSNSSDGLTNSETPTSNTSNATQKNVRFNTSMDAIKEEPQGVLREYSNIFYEMLASKKSTKTSETKTSTPSSNYGNQRETQRKQRQQSFQNLSMVSQASILIGHNETAGKISGVLLLNEIYLIVIDRVNNKMKVFDSRDRYKMVVDRRIPKGAWGVVSPEDNIIAMTCRNKIIFFGLFETKTPRYERQFDPVIQPLEVEYRVRASCYGISFCESRDLFFIACNVFFSDPSIFIVDTKGYTQHVIRTIDDGISPTIPFSETLAVDSDRGVIYIGDRIGKRIVCATYDGKHVWNVNLVGKPVSIALANDNIYVNVDGKVICLLHKDGRFIRNLIYLDLDGRRICHHSSANQLIVLTKAFWGVSHFIQIYQL